MGAAPIGFAANVDPSAASLPDARAIARRANELGLDLIGIWVGAYKPRMLNLIGRPADGWVPFPPYAPPDQIPPMQQRIDDAAREDGRDPGAIRRIYNVMGEITDGATRGLLEGPVEHWIEELTRFVVELRFDTFTFWARDNYLDQLERFAREVVPGVRETAAQAQT